MTENVENPVLETLRRVDGKIDTFSSKVAAQDAEFKRLFTRLDDQDEVIVTALCLTGQSNVLHDRTATKFAAVESELADPRARIERLENAT